MKDNKKIVIKSLMIISYLLSIYIYPITVYSLEKVTNNFSDIEKAIIENRENNKDFNYKMTTEETLKVVFGYKELKSIITDYIKEKYQVNYNITVDTDNLKYTISDNDNIYNGIFTYEENFKLEKIKNDKDNIEYIKEETATILDVDSNLIEVVDLNSNKYEIKINKTTTLVELIDNNSVSRNIEDANIYYQTHVQNIGWQSPVTNGEIAGTTGLGKAVEALKIKVTNSNVTGDVVYQTHVSGIGWQSEVGNDNIAGTTGQGRSVEALRIKLTNEMAEQYDIYYRVHVQNIGWLDWAKNGASAGTEGYGLHIESLQIKLVKKGESAPGNTTNAFIKRPISISYATHVQNIGWQKSVENGEIAGTTGLGKAVEALKIKITNSDVLGDITYQAHISGIGWQNEVSNDTVAGTTGQGRSVEALKIKLTNEMAEQYDIYYRVHVQNIGWLDWAKNGASAGTEGYGYHIESLQIELIKKGESISGETTTPFLKKEIGLYYQAHISKTGWQNAVETGATAGTTGQGKAVEALKIKVTNSDIVGDIIYQAHVSGIGWQNEVSNNDIAGTTGQGKAIEALKIKLTGELAKQYDIYYRTHVQNYGWLDWAQSDQVSGSTGLGYQVEAVEIKLVKKGESAPGNTTRPALLGKWVVKDGNTYYYDQFGNMANDFKVIDGTKYFFNSLGVLIGSNVRKVIDVSAHNGVIDWDTVKNSGTIDAVILRVAAGSATEDSLLSRNVSELKRVGIPYGIYIYSYAENQIGTVSGLGTMHEAALEAERINNAIKKYSMNLSFPIYYDLEVWENKNNSLWTTNNYRPIIDAFANKMREYNQEWRIYTNTAWANTALNTPDIKNKIDWIAQYNHNCTYTGLYSGWQYSSKESVPGINGNVDANVWFN